MYIIEFEKGVYATKGSGDPARTLKVENAQRFSDWMKARLKLDKVLKEIKAFRKFPNAKVEWVDEVTGALGDSLHETSGLNIPRVSKTKRSEVAVIKCPECLTACKQEELDMFGGLCEECSGAFDD